MVFLKKILFISLLYTFVQSKTIRSKIHTTESGRKQLSFANGTDVNQQDIDSLLKNLNEMNITTELATQMPQTEVEITHAPNDSNEELKESILMQHWNSLTEVGWRNFTEPIKKMYLNSTRILRLAPEFKKEENAGGGKRANKTDVKTAEGKPPADNIKPPAIFDLCRSVIDLCQIGQPRIKREDLVRCLTLKNKTLLEIVEEQVEENDTFNCPEEDIESSTEVATAVNDESARTILRPRRLLHKVLLPLMVILIIKYLVTIPFVALSVFTLNAMWLGLLSIGAVLFAKFKGHDYFSQKYPHRRFTHFPQGEMYDVSSPFSMSDIIWSPVRVPLSQTTIGTHT